MTEKMVGILSRQLYVDTVLEKKEMPLLHLQNEKMEIQAIKNFKDNKIECISMVSSKKHVEIVIASNMCSFTSNLDGYEFTSTKEQDGEPKPERIEHGETNEY
jgi:hypothetical protein